MSVNIFLDCSQDNKIFNYNLTPIKSQFRASYFHNKRIVYTKWSFKEII